VGGSGHGFLLFGVIGEIKALLGSSENFFDFLMGWADGSLRRWGSWGNGSISRKFWEFLLFPQWVLKNAPAVGQGQNPFGVYAIARSRVLMSPSRD
jgi:hypothetical protein